MVEGVSRMREIKFRAWHKKQKRWIKFMSIVWGDFGSPNPDDRVDKLAWIADGEYSYSPADFELMQYTGLKDKNGKEIYEGDILAWLNLAKPLEVKRCPFHARFLAGLDLLSKGIAMESKVIGNIHENPELLK